MELRIHNHFAILISNVGLQSFAVKEVPTYIELSREFVSSIECVLNGHYPHVTFCLTGQARHMSLVAFCEAIRVKKPWYSS